MATSGELQEKFKDGSGDDRAWHPADVQIEFADVIGLSKCDLVPPEEVQKVEASLKLNLDQVIRVS